MNQKMDVGCKGYWLPCYIEIEKEMPYSWHDGKFRFWYTHNIGYNPMTKKVFASTWM
jgi:hypothetical protein